MKKVALYSALASVILSTGVEYCAYLKGWRPEFFEIDELISILYFSICIFVVTVLYCLLLVRILKHINLRSWLTMAIISCLSAASLVYLDDSRGSSNWLSLSGILTLLIIAFILFISGCSLLMLYKKPLKTQEVQECDATKA
jgi:hypothetical protein